MKRRSLCFLAIICLLLPCYSNAQIKLKRRTFLEGKVDLSVPVDFIQLSEDSLTRRFDNAKEKPAVMLVGDNNRVSILIQPLSQDMGADSMGMVDYKMFLWGTLKSTYPEIEKVEEGVEEIHGKYVAFFKTSNVGRTGKGTIYYFFTVSDGKIMLFTITCTGEVASKWADALDKIRDSLRCVG